MANYIDSRSKGSDEFGKTVFPDVINASEVICTILSNT